MTNLAEKETEKWKNKWWNSRNRWNWKQNPQRVKRERSLLQCLLCGH